MYPKVKVRKQEEEEQLDKGSFLLLDDFNLLSLQDGVSHDKEYASDSPPSIVKIPKNYVPSFTTPSVSLPEGKNNKNTKDNKPNIKASPVPRPRAVLSSPENDGMIGNINQLSTGKKSVVKKPTLGENADSQGKGNTRCLKAKGPVNTRPGSKDTTTNSSFSSGKKTPELAVPKQSGYLRKGRQRSIEKSSSNIQSHPQVNIR